MVALLTVSELDEMVEKGITLLFCGFLVLRLSNPTLCDSLVQNRLQKLVDDAHVLRRPIVEELLQLPDPAQAQPHREDTLHAQDRLRELGSSVRWEERLCGCGVDMRMRQWQWALETMNACSEKEFGCAVEGEPLNQVLWQYVSGHASFGNYKCYVPGSRRRVHP